MKFIKPSNKILFKDGDRRPDYLILDDILFESVAEQIAEEMGRPFNEIADVSDVYEVGIDGGGMIHMDEPQVEITIDGTNISCFARQLELMLPVLDNIKDLPGGHRGAFFGGAWVNYMFEEQTVNRIKKAFKAKEIEMKDEINKWWSKMDSERIHKTEDGKLAAISLSREQMHEFPSEDDRRELLAHEMMKHGRSMKNDS